MSKDVFRKVSLERLSSPERLDELMQVTTSKGWFALFTLIFLAVAAIVWGIFGSVSTKVYGTGILIKSGGVFKIVSRGFGQVTDLRVNADDVIKKGQIIARIGQPDLMDQLKKARAELEELKNQHRMTYRFGTKGFQLQIDALDQQKRNLKSAISVYEDQLKWLDEKIELEKISIEQERKNTGASIKAYEDQLKWLKERIQTQEELLAKGLITKNALITTRQEHDSVSLKINELRAKEQSLTEGLQSKKTLVDTKQQYEAIVSKIKQTQNELKQLSLKNLQAENKKDQELLNIQQKINFAERRIVSLKEQKDVSSKVVSPYTGRILEVMVNMGDIVKKGSPVLNMELMGKEIKNLEAVLYIPAADGKKVTPGMDVQISPTTVKAEEYGFIKGKVNSVSEFPATYEGMMRVLNNSNLVQMLTGQAAPIEVYADLLPSDQTVSGFKWSSPDGPPLKIFSGTICSATVTVREQAPITLVIPLLKSYLLGYGD